MQATGNSTWQTANFVDFVCICRFTAAGQRQGVKKNFLVKLPGTTDDQTDFVTAPQ